MLSVALHKNVETWTTSVNYKKLHQYENDLKGEINIIII